MKAKNPRAALEMIELGEDLEWIPMAGFPGLESITLGDDLDEQKRRGARTRLVRFSPGAVTNNRLVHSYWEEVLILSGELATHHADTVDQEVQASADAKQPADFPIRYSLRPPGTEHGPFTSPGGCVLFEVQYFLAD